MGFRFPGLSGEKGWESRCGVCPGRVELTQGGGTGLVSLRERFAVLGGALEAGAAGNDRRVAGTLPIARVVRTPSAPQYGAEGL